MTIKTWGVAVAKRSAVEDFEIRLWPGRHGIPEPPPEDWEVHQFKSLGTALAYIKGQMLGRIGPWERAE